MTGVSTEVMSGVTRDQLPVVPRKTLYLVYLAKAEPKVKPGPILYLEHGQYWTLLTVRPVLVILAPFRPFGLNSARTMTFGHL